MTFFEVLRISSDFDPTHSLVTSPVVGPLVLAAIRLTLAVYTLTTLIVDLAYTSAVLGTGSTFFTYFTELSYTGLCAYFWASGIQTFAYAIRIGHAGKLGSENKHYPLQRWPRALQFLHVLLLSSVVTYAILITIVYWAVLSSSKSFDNPFDAWSNISLHILNTCSVLLEILFTNIRPLPWIHLPFLVFILGCYLGLAYLTYYTQHFYVYNFLNPQIEQSKLAGWIVGIAAAEVVVFVIVHFVCVLRERIAARFH